MKPIIKKINTFAFFSYKRVFSQNNEFLYLISDYIKIQMKLL